ncbi:hypothetical protein [Ruegeria sp. HKCCD8929]|uniref:hypothetical protein n=1 Tax=Ruegeria sp. HKCCD8929 TaxID=2683006 RepID=UPI0014896829|nr:hypothetical protein [Ruegeria sp. HKCCD8929]
MSFLVKNKGKLEDGTFAVLLIADDVTDLKVFDRGERVDFQRNGTSSVICRPADEPKREPEAEDQSAEGEPPLKLGPENYTDDDMDDWFRELDDRLETETS